MSGILTYLMIGVVFAFLYDSVGEYYDYDEDKRFTNRERVVVILIWPIALITFIYTLIKTFMNGPN